MKKIHLPLSPICCVYLLYACGGSRAPIVIAPSISTTEAQLMASPATVGSPYNFVFQPVSGTLGGPVTWTVVGLPANGLSFDPNSGAVTGTATASTSMAVSLTVTDTGGHSSPTMKYTISVVNPPPPNFVTKPTDVTPVWIENPYRFSFAVSGGLAPLVWTETGNLPATLAFDANGVLSGTTATMGSYPITLVVQDALGQKTAQNFSITVTTPPPPTVNTTPAPTAGVENRAYKFAFSVTGGYPPISWTESGGLPAGMVFSSLGALSGTPTLTGTFPIAVTAQDSHGETAGPQDFTIQVALGFNSTGSMTTPRQLHTATLLNTGKVLIAGGQSDLPGASALATAEVYDPAAAAFSPTGGMQTARAGHVAVLLKDGSVLVAGGVDGNGVKLVSAELYDPVKATFTVTGDMHTARAAPVAVALQDGRVLVAGGLDVNGNELASAELFDPVTGIFTSTNEMTSPRAGHTATLLNSGKVLVAGGRSAANDVLASAELFDPSNQTFTTTTHSMTVARAGHTATLLKDGTVLLTGPDTTAEIYTPGSEVFAAAGSLASTTAESGTTATLRNDGTVLLAGGGNKALAVFPCTTSSFESVADAELFDPITGSFASTNAMNVRRSMHTATLLTNGRILLSGGITTTLDHSRYGCKSGPMESVTPSAELFP